MMKRSSMDAPRYEETVAVINSSEDTVEMLRCALQNSGFNSVLHPASRKQVSGITAKQLRTSLLE